jgi:H+-transporting ATPase
LGIYDQTINQVIFIHHYSKGLTIIKLARNTDDFKTISTEEALKEVKGNMDGLTALEAHLRLEQFGYNEIKEKEKNPILKLLSYFYGPMPIAIEAAAIVSAVIGHWDDFILIIALLITNVIIGFWQERSAGNAIKELMKKLGLKARVLRDKAWASLDAKELVPGDIIRLRMGDIVPADTKLIQRDFLSVDQSALTGESLPVEKHPGDIVYSGSIIKQGEMNGLVINTGERTYFGHMARLVASASNVTGLSRIISKIVYFLVGLAIVLGTIVFYYGIILGFPILGDLLFFLILLVASIPIALPVVLTVTMALGALSLANKKAIVTKLVSIEELASMDVLCTDKTGTLTENKLTAGTVFPVDQSNTVHDVLLYAALASRRDDMDAIDQAIYAQIGDSDKVYRQLKFIPFDPMRKRTEATVEFNGNTYQTMKGEPDTVLSLCNVNNSVKIEIEKEIDDFAVKGYRILAVAKNDGNEWKFIGLIPLYDPLREDSKKTIATAGKMGIAVKIVTGDNEAIAKEIGSELDLGSKVISSADLESVIKSENWKAIEDADIFARVYPEHKYTIVKGLQANGHTVGMTGDGVNDAPALKEAQVGIAVEGATDAARSAADIVLTAPGLSTIINAVQEGRRIFQRMQSYVLYRVVETLRILIFVTATIILLHFYPISAFLLIILALLNDLPIIAVSTDNVLYSQRPEKWNMKYIGGLSVLLGGMGSAETLLLVYVGMYIFHVGIPAILSLVFLKLIVSGHLTMFVTRTKRAFWKVSPSMPLLIALISTMVVGFVMTAFGLGVTPIGITMGSLVVVYALSWFLVEDSLRLLYDRITGRSAGSQGTPQLR